MFASVFPEIVLRGSFPFWLAIVLMVAIAGLAGAFYFTESMKLGTGRRLLLAGLRALVLCAIVFLLCKPVAVRDVSTEKSRAVVLLADNSQSMTHKDPRPATADKVRLAIATDKLPPDHGIKTPANIATLSADRPSRADVARAAFENKRLDLVGNLRAKGPVQPFLFGSRLRGFADADDRPWLKALNADDPKSEITDTVAELLQRDENDLPAAIVLVTDGRDNGSQTAWDDLSREAARLKVPVHVYGIGGSAAGFLVLKDAAIQDTLFVEDTVTVPFRFRTQGLKDADVELTLTLGGKEVASKRVTAKDGQDVTETLSFTPAKEDAAVGKKEIVASVKVVQGQEPLQDRFAKMVRVADRKAMESGPPFLPNFPDQRKDLFAYDLLVIGDVDANYFTAEQRNWIKDFVAEGGGLVVIAGRLHAPATWLGTPLADVLPVEVPSVKFPLDDVRRPAEYKPVLSDLGRRSPILSMSDDPTEQQEVWDDLPGFYWNYPVTKLRPAAVSLMDHPREKIAEDKPMPLLAMQYYGKGLVLFSATDETWRWRYNEADKYFARYWGQVVYAIGLPHTLGSKAGQLAIAGGEAVLGKPSPVYARLFTPEYRPQTAERVTAQMERLDAGPNEEKFGTVTFEAVPNQPGEYVATVPNDRVGRYTLKVESGEETATLDYRVILPPEHELAPGPMNEDGLRKLAEETGGKFYREEDLHHLADDVRPQTVTFTQRKETLLWTYWPVWAFVVCLFTLEWVVRKLSNMS